MKFCKLAVDGPTFVVRCSVSSICKKSSQEYGHADW